MLRFKCKHCIVCLFVFLGCEIIEIPYAETKDLDVTSYSYEAYQINSSEVLERVWQMATVEWTPVNPVPKNGGGYYNPGKTVLGIPYSSVKEINTYLFQDVSYYTFMTAVHNPKSVLYTENISQAPYHGLNCAPYYGAVCSSTVMYALGVSIPFYANQIIKLPFMHQLEHQVVDSLKVCDVLWKSGHVQMVYDVEHRADTLYKMTMFESSGASAHIKTYTSESFKEMWKAYNYVAYRYDNIVYTTRPESFAGLKSIDYNDDLCPSKGDKAVYRTVDAICINIFNQNYQEIVLQKDNEEISADTYNNDYYYSGLEPGIYMAYLRSNEKESEPVSFEVIQADVNVSLTDDGNLLIEFSSSGMADYVAVCNVNGTSEYYSISEEDRRRGHIVVPPCSYAEYYCKVVFKGEYGTMINKPIRVK